MSWLEGWHDFFVAEVGASGALTGLLFVAISINVTRIIAYKWLPSRAAQVLIVMLGVLLTSSLPLVPGQSRPVLGAELLTLNLIVLAVGLFWNIRVPTPEPYRFGQTLNSGFFLLTLSVLIAGSSMLLLVPSPSGMYAIMAGVMLSFVYALYNSWILLVEILR